MRDILNILETLVTEGSILSAGEISKYPARFNKFIQNITDGRPFYTTDGEEVIINPNEADRFLELYNDPDGSKFKGAIKAIIDDGRELPLSKFVKTKEFGGEGLTGQAGEIAGKESAQLKPKQIGITGQNIPSYEFGNMIVNNTILQSTPQGQAVIQMAYSIMAAEDPVIPEEFRTKDNVKILKAIVDYAGEYLGVLALLYNKTRFPKKQDFLTWLGGTVDDFVLNFPEDENNNLADSFAAISNPTTSHSINISSKGTGGGAAPAISGLKIPDSIRDNPKLAGALEFIDLCKEEGTMSVAFKGMNLVHKYAPNAIPKEFRKYLPWSQSAMQVIFNNYKTFKKPGYIPLLKYYPLWENTRFTSDASDAGKLTYVVNKAVLTAMNENKAMPEFEQAIMEILDMNFIQQYTDYQGNKSGIIKFSTQWPAKLDGHITVEAKMSAGSPTSGGFSFKLSRTTAKSDYGDEEQGSESEDEIVGGMPLGGLSAASSNIVNPSNKKKEIGKRTKRK